MYTFRTIVCLFNNLLESIDAPVHRQFKLEIRFYFFHWMSLNPPPPPVSHLRICGESSRARVVFDRP